MKREPILRGLLALGVGFFSIGLAKLSADEEIKNAVCTLIATCDECDDYPTGGKWYKCEGTNWVKRCEKVTPDPDPKTQKICIVLTTTCFKCKSFEEEDCQGEFKDAGQVEYPYCSQKQ